MVSKIYLIHYNYFKINYFILNKLLISGKIVMEKIEEIYNDNKLGINTKLDSIHKDIKRLMEEIQSRISRFDVSYFKKGIFKFNKYLYRR